MGIKKNFLIILFIILSISSSFAVGKGGRDDFSYLEAKTSDFIKGKNFFKQGIKYEKKNKINKANKRFEKALKYFVSANKKYPDNIEILKFLGLTYNQVGDIFMTEIYFKEGLSIDPKNILINKGLGELYFNTKRIGLAQERLEVLSFCNCQEYLDLKSIIKSN